MDVLKYFYEEPAALEAAPVPPGLPAGDGLTPLDALLSGSTAYRGYLAGTHLPVGPGDPLRIGATALAAPRLWTAPLLDLFGGDAWTACAEDGAVVSVDDPEARLAQPSGLRALAVAPGAVEAEVLRSASLRREDRPALLALLATVRTVAFPEPAHDGFDLHLFSAQPLRAPFVEALQRHPAPAGRRFVLPYQRARGEHRFYFEQWQLDALPDFVEEV